MKRSLVYLAVLAALPSTPAVRCARCGGFGHLPKDCGWPLDPLVVIDGGRRLGRASGAFASSFWAGASLNG